MQDEMPIYAEPRKRINKKRALLLALLIICVLALILFIAREIYDIGERRSIAGIRDPIQTDAIGKEKFSSWGFDIEIEYLYAYDIEGLVTHTRRYFGFGLADVLSPMDVGLAWGKVAEFNDRIDFHWDHNDRQLTAKADSYAEILRLGGEAYFYTHFSNNHLIPADGDVRRSIKKIRRGDHIRLKGYLVDVTGKRWGKETLWESSVSRSDRGQHACEVIYVTEVEFIDT